MDEAVLDAPLGATETGAISEKDMRQGPDVAKRQANLMPVQGVVLLYGKSLEIKSEDRNGNKIKDGPIITIGFEGRDEASKGFTLSADIFLNGTDLGLDKPGTAVLRTFIAAAKAGDFGSSDALFSYVNGLDLKAMTARQLREILLDKEYHCKARVKPMGQDQYKRWVTVISIGVTKFEVERLLVENAKMTPPRTLTYAIKDDLLRYRSGAIGATGGTLGQKSEGTKSNGNGNGNGHGQRPNAGGKPIDAETARKIDETLG